MGGKSSVSWVTSAALLVLPLFAGALWGGIDLAIAALWGEPPPDWPWYGYLWRAYGLGALMILGEGMFEALSEWTQRRRARREGRLRL